MATGTAGTAARQYHQSLVHYLRADFNVAEADVSGGTTKTLGVIPAGSVIIKPMSGFATHVAFDDTTVVDIGDGTTIDLYATNLATSSIGFVAIDEAVANKVYVDTTIRCNVAGNGSVTVGNGSAIICYTLDNEGALTWAGEQS
jgi:hypothetical protein